MNNRINSVMRISVSTLLCLLIVLSITVPCFAADDETLTVKVGFFEFEGYHEQDENGNLSGYGYEMLQHISGYAGLRYEYVGYDKSWSEMQDMLAAGEIDLLSSAQKTPEREARFDFSSTNIGVSATVLTVKKGDTEFFGMDCDCWNGIRVGMIKGNSRNNSFEEYAGAQGFTYEPVFFDSTEEMSAELQSDSADKRIDAIVTSNLRKTANEWIIAQFDASPFYIMVQKGNDELLSRINRAILQMDVCEPGIRTMLLNKYYTSEADSEVVFTAEERRYIAEMSDHEFTATINPDRAPYSYYSDGKLEGIAYDAAQAIIDRTGLNIRFMDLQDSESYFAAVDAGNIDIRFEVSNSYNSAEAYECWLTVPFISIPMARLCREDTTEFITTAEPASRDVAENYEKMLRELGFEPEFYDTVEQVVEAVISGECDMSYLAIDTAMLAVRNDYTNRLISEEVFGKDTNYMVAVSNTQNPLLYSILNKAAASITKTQVDAIRQNYAANLEKQTSVIGYIYDYPLHVFMAVLIFLAIVTLIVTLISLSKRKKDDYQHLVEKNAQNEILKDALDSAEKAGAAKSQFLSRVSHEMRTPLNAIIGFIELAKDADAEKAADYLKSSDVAAKQLLSVINDVLDMSSIESGKMKISNTNFNFRNVVSSLTNIYGEQCKQKEVSFETKFKTPVDDWLIGDELRVNQILMNLLGNAVKFTSEGYVWLTVSEKSADDGKVFVSFTVSDTGCGMSQELKDRLFKPFEQESATTARKYGGSGLGLSIVKNLVSMMGGNISVESEQGVGTSFTVNLPFSRSDIVQDISMPRNVTALHVLAVDDELTEREYISLVLKRMGVRYKCVGSGSEALAELERAERENDNYNVCLIDYRMPDMNGVDTTMSIRQKYGKDVVVIVVSAYDFQQTDETARNAGANLFLSKPVFQSSLYDLFMSLTGGAVAISKDNDQVWDFTGKKVLLVEDNTLNQVVAKGYLEKCNLIVDTADNGQIAVDMFTSSEPGYYDAILMDIQMPVMDGFAATEAIRKSNHPDGKTIQIIAQTADAFNEDITRALSAGMNAHVAKPIKPSILAKALHRAFFESKSNKKM